MTRIPGVAKEDASAVAKEAFERVERGFGSLPEPLRVMAHSDSILQASLGFDRYLSRAARLDARFKSLASVKTAALIGCPF
jgi:hypothetical protein